MQRWGGGLTQRFAAELFGLASIEKYVQGILGRLGGANPSRGYCVGFPGASASEGTVGGLRRDRNLFAATLFAPASSLRFGTRIGGREGFQHNFKSCLDGGRLLDFGRKWVDER